MPFHYRRRGSQATLERQEGHSMQDIAGHEGSGDLDFYPGSKILLEGVRRGGPLRRLLSSVVLGGGLERFEREKCQELVIAWIWRRVSRMALWIFANMHLLSSYPGRGGSPMLSRSCMHHASYKLRAAKGPSKLGLTFLLGQAWFWWECWLASVLPFLQMPSPSTNTSCCC